MRVVAIYDVVSAMAYMYTHTHITDLCGRFKSPLAHSEERFVYIMGPWQPFNDGDYVCDDNVFIARFLCNYPKYFLIHRQPSKTFSARNISHVGENIWKFLTYPVYPLFRYFDCPETVCVEVAMMKQSTQTDDVALHLTMQTGYSNLSYWNAGYWKMMEIHLVLLRSRVIQLDAVMCKCHWGEKVARIRNLQIIAP